MKDNGEWMCRHFKRELKKISSRKELTAITSHEIEDFSAMSTNKISYGGEKHTER